MIFGLYPLLSERTQILGLVFAGLAIGHVGLLWLLLRPRGVRLLQSSIFLASDVTVAFGFYLWTASAEQPGAILVPTGDAAWMYIFCTVALWLTARDLPVGGAILLAAFALEFVAVAVNGGGSDGVLIAQHLIQVTIIGTFAVFLMASVRGGADRVLDQSLRAGREVERVKTLAGLHRQVLATWETLAARPPGVNAAQRLDEVRTTAAAMSNHIRAVLKRHPSAADPEGLGSQLDRLVGDVRGAGLKAELVVTELRGDPPPDVIQALVEATRRILADLVGRPPEGAVVVRVTGSPADVEVSVRDQTARATANPGTIAAMAAVGGRVEVRARPSRATRTRLHWSAP